MQNIAENLLKTFDSGAINPPLHERALWVGGECLHYPLFTPLISLLSVSRQENNFFLATRKSIGENCLTIRIRIWLIMTQYKGQYDMTASGFDPFKKTEQDTWPDPLFFSQRSDPDPDPGYLPPDPQPYFSHVFISLCVCLCRTSLWSRACPSRRPRTLTLPSSARYSLCSTIFASDIVCLLFIVTWRFSCKIKKVWP